MNAAAPAVVTILRDDGGSGSGFVISEDGWVVTNAHVVEEKGALVTVTLEDRRKFVAKVRDCSFYFFLGNLNHSRRR